MRRFEIDSSDSAPARPPAPLGQTIRLEASRRRNGALSCHARSFRASPTALRVLFAPTMVVVVMVMVPPRAAVRVPPVGVVARRRHRVIPVTALSDCASAIPGACAGDSRHQGGAQECDKDEPFHDFSLSSLVNVMCPAPAARTVATSGIAFQRRNRTRQSVQSKIH